MVESDPFFTNLNNVSAAVFSVPDAPHKVPALRYSIFTSDHLHVNSVSLPEVASGQLTLCLAVSVRAFRLQSSPWIQPTCPRHYQPVRHRSTRSEPSARIEYKMFHRNSRNDLQPYRTIDAPYSHQSARRSAAFTDLFADCLATFTSSRFSLGFQQWSYVIRKR